MPRPTSLRRDRQAPGRQPGRRARACSSIARRPTLRRSGWRPRATGSRHTCTAGQDRSAPAARAAPRPSPRRPAARPGAARSASAISASRAPLRRENVDRARPPRAHGQRRLAAPRTAEQDDEVIAAAPGSRAPSPTTGPARGSALDQRRGRHLARRARARSGRGRAAAAGRRTGRRGSGRASRDARSARRRGGARR